MNESQRSTFVRVESGASSRPGEREAPDAGISAGTPPSGAAECQVAVLIVHGMGQQVRFETLEGVANALLDAHRRGSPATAVASTIRVAVRRVPNVEPELFRAEVALPGGPTAHLYEAYWAPLTEGRIGLIDTLRFLLDGARMGWHRAVLGGFRRLMFEGWQHFSLGSSVALLLSIALGLLVTWSLIGAAVALAAISHLARGAFGGWPPADRLPLVTSDLAIALLALVAIGLGLVVASLPRRRLADGRVRVPSAPLRTVAWALVAIGLAATLFGGLRLVSHLVRSAGISPIARALGPRSLAWWAVIAIVLVALGTLVARRLHRVRIARLERLEHPDVTLLERLSLTASGFGVALLIAVMAVGSGAWLTPAFVPPSLTLGTWGAAALIALGLRAFLIEYVGDVAVYVSAHTVSRFQETREAIQRVALVTARSVYAMRADESAAYRYDRVIVAGHSLGSVVAYDTLNALIRQQPELGVSERTALFLTFGSPLDKTAFIFRNQRSEDSDVREALAEAVQPLIDSDVARPLRWVNLWSRNDPISSRLEFYDREGAHGAREAAPRVGGHRVVENRIDPDATTPLLAHNEYWSGETLPGWLLAGITGREPA